MKPANFAPVYLCLYPQLAEVARSHGYALSIHGSLGRDFDLVCIPWVDEPSSPQEVIESITNKFSIKQVGDPGQKKHGRVAYTLSLSFGECAIDLSFMPTSNHEIDWREHSKNFAKGEKCPDTLETAQAAWARDQELISDHLKEISKLKDKINKLNHKLEAQTKGAFLPEEPPVETRLAMQYIEGLKDTIAQDLLWRAIKYTTRNHQIPLTNFLKEVGDVVSAYSGDPDTRGNLTISLIKDTSDLKLGDKIYCLKSIKSS